ncbi:MAG: class I SAM-dependent methyltransferase [Acidimicrobiales bacterium]
MRGPGEGAGDGEGVGDVRRRVDSLLWFHSIDVGHGVVTKGISEATLPDALLPDFRGKSVLDIGAWDGYYSYLAERRGASRVVAIDHYAWGVDIPARNAYWVECAQAGRLPDHRRDVTQFWRPDLPGKRGFDLAHELLDSKVESVVADFTEIEVAELGTFDVVVYCGVLYHMKEPLTCLERVRTVTDEVAVVETEAIHLQHLEGLPLSQFRAGNEVNGDFGNWWVPDLSSLRAMCRAAGFASTTVLQGPPPPPEPDPATVPAGLGANLEAVGRALLRRWRNGGQPPPEPPPPSAPTQHYRAVLHAHA